MKVVLDPYYKKGGKRKIKIQIDPWDVWNFDHSLALIIAPALKLLKEKKRGGPFVDDEDVPEELKSTNAEPKENEWDTDSNFFLRRDYVLDEMIWTFDHIISEEGDWLDIDNDRIMNGLRLFLRYYICK